MRLDVRPNLDAVYIRILLEAQNIRLRDCEVYEDGRVSISVRELSASNMTASEEVG